MDIHISRSDLSRFIQSLLDEASRYSSTFSEAIAELKDTRESDKAGEAWCEAVTRLDPKVIDDYIWRKHVAARAFTARMETARIFQLVNNVEYNQVLKAFESLQDRLVINNDFVEWRDMLETMLYSVLVTDKVVE